MNHQDTITPCPISGRFKIPIREAWQLLGVFLIYRFIIACLFSGLFIFNVGPALLGKHDPFLYGITSSIYLLMTVFQGIAFLSKKPHYSIQAQLQIFIDLVCLTLLMHACGGIVSGIGILLAVTVAAAGLLVGGRCALLFAALASLFILTEQVYSDLTDAFEQTAYTYSGMLGASFFTISLLALVLANRAEENAEIAARRSADIENLQQLNDYVIQHLRSGIIVLDPKHNIKMMNESALRLFKLSSNPRELNSLSTELSWHYDDWLKEKKYNDCKMPMGNSSDINVIFTTIGENETTFNMIFLEDPALSDQRVQQSKLASLGRLAASIAHEIRNPLSAISHASQLLEESPSQSTEDQRLTEIIRNHTHRVNEIIENVLQISRRTPPQLIDIELVSWLKKFLQEYTLDSRLNPQPFDLNPGPEEANACFDESHLKQILDNLCANALKYGSADRGKISLKIVPKDQYFCIEVIDKGPGISKQNQKNIFEPFFTTSNSGTGLGLYISRELAELNRASLEYESVAVGGSCFRLSLSNAKTTIIEI